MFADYARAAASARKCHASYLSDLSVGASGCGFEECLNLELVLLVRVLDAFHEVKALPNKGGHDANLLMDSDSVEECEIGGCRKVFRSRSRAGAGRVAGWVNILLLCLSLAVGLLPQGSHRGVFYSS